MARGKSDTCLGDRFFSRSRDCSSHTTHGRPTVESAAFLCVVRCFRRSYVCPGPTAPIASQVCLRRVVTVHVQHFTTIQHVGELDDTGHSTALEHLHIWSMSV
jgi:hypothetical protein